MSSFNCIFTSLTSSLTLSISKSKLKMSPTILVTGATGAQGSGVVKQLLAQNIAVHAFVRDPTSPASLALQTAGAILFKGDYDDVPSITAAIQGCTGVFLNTFPSFTDPDGEGHQAENFITAAHATGTVTTFIASTVMRPTEEQLAAVGTQYPFVSYYYKQKKGVEDRVKNAGFKYHTILQPGFLMYNFIAPTTMYHFPDYPTTHIMKAHWGPDFEIELFDPADVGKFALAAFLDPGSFNGETLYLVNESLTTDQVAVKIKKG
ncbi:putative NmrA-like family domain-containing protein [Glarea lozoyensis 74030]|uniref:Putative NmrA-like family domain-containing protein n=1 Tax=Glarea lozoyensis (strain ATCC 74030 / MF5533) TaxID=1104152 RepID=H0EW49_GLAL7|nr:putative NmrA-like family domain-containing protein [Glarea lozoyensis 74030]